MSTKILLVSSGGLPELPWNIENQIKNLMAQYPDVQFIIGDRLSDNIFNKALSGIGARSKSFVYYLDSLKRNNFDLNTWGFHSEYIIENGQANIICDSNGEVVWEVYGLKSEQDLPYKSDYYNFIMKQMIKDCSACICIWDGEDKRVMEYIKLLGIYGKECCLYRI